MSTGPAALVVLRLTPSHDLCSTATRQKGPPVTNNLTPPSGIPFARLNKVYLGIEFLGPSTNLETMGQGEIERCGYSTSVAPSKDTDSATASMLMEIFPLPPLRNYLTISRYTGNQNRLRPPDSRSTQISSARVLQDHKPFSPAKLPLSKIVELLNTSLRLVICGPSAYSKSDSHLKEDSFTRNPIHIGPSLSHISPALFSPKYLQV